MRVKWTFALSVTAILAALPGTGEAEEEIRWLDRQGSSSDCIGSPASAVCAVETALACRLRGDAALCRTVGLTLPPGHELPFARSNPDPFAVVEATAMKYKIRDEEEGDNRRIGVSMRFHGKYGLNWPDRGWRRLIYGVHRLDGKWRVENISWQPLVRLIAPDDSPGKCIGKYESPVCAIESHIACRVRGDKTLCAGKEGLEPKHFRPKGATVLYYIDRIRKWEPPETSAPGELLTVVWAAESTDLPTPGKADPGGAYITRPDFVAVSYILDLQAGQWRVLSRTERP